MLQAGICITAKDDPLRKVELDYLYHAIKNPKQNVISKINLLRQVKNLDKEQYALQKRKLPYLVCGLFNPPIRKKEFFAKIKFFMIDIDHIAEKGLSVNALRNKFAGDDRILLEFLSPSEDGIKLLFELDEYCTDHVKYSAFYKLFAAAFAKQYQLDQVIDFATSDVTRACFISFDPQVRYNKLATKIKMSDFIDFQNPFLANQIINDLNNKEPKLQNTDKIPISEDIFSEIKQKLNPKNISKPLKNVYVPEQLELVIEQVVKNLESYEINIVGIKNISFGKKINLNFKGKIGEINLFYGKKGFTVVESPKNGTDMELNNLSAKIILEAVLQYS